LLIHFGRGGEGLKKNYPYETKKKKRKRDTDCSCNEPRNNGKMKRRKRTDTRDHKNTGGRGRPRPGKKTSGHERKGCKTGCGSEGREIGKSVGGKIIKGQKIGKKGKWAGK